MPISENFFGEMKIGDAAEQIITGLMAGFGTGVAYEKFGETIGVAIGGAVGVLKLAETQGFLNPGSGSNSNGAAAHWYTNLIGDESGVHINELHIFLASFGGGLALELLAKAGLPNYKNLESTENSGQTQDTTI